MEESSEQEAARRLRAMLGVEWRTVNRVGGDGNPLHGVEFKYGLYVINVWLLNKTETTPRPAVVVTVDRQHGGEEEVAAGRSKVVKITEHLLSLVDPDPVDRCAAAERLLRLVQTRLDESIHAVDASLGEVYSRTLVSSR